MKRRPIPGHPSCAHANGIGSSRRHDDIQRGSYRRSLSGISIIMLSLLPASACNNGRRPDAVADISFDRVNWRTKEHGVYIHRRRMIADLLQAKPLAGATKDSVIRLLGSPDGTAGGTFWYAFDEEFTLLGTSQNVLFFELTSDSTVKSVMERNIGAWD